MTIKKKLTFLLLCWSIVVLLIGNTIVFLAYLSISKNQMEDSLESKGEQLIEGVSPQQLLFSDSEKILMSHIPDNGMIRLFDSKNKLVFAQADEEELLSMSPIILKNEGTKIVRLNGNPVIVASIPIFQNERYLGTIELSTVAEDLWEDSQLLLTILLVVSIILIIISAAIGHKTAQIFLKPISIMVKTMSEIEKNERFEKIPLESKGRDELFKMAQTFNSMIDRLKNMFKKQEQFIYDASHELKTPLTVIESNASMLKRWGKDDKEILNEGIEAISEESKRLKLMIAQLLALARSEEVIYELQPVEVVDLCNKVSKRLSKSTNRIINVKPDFSSIWVKGNKEKLIQVFIILLDNALKYSHSFVEIEISDRKDHVLITFIDYGEGIPADDLPHIFDRFYRVDKARHRETGGTGLGLAIAKTIIHQHGGSIEIKSREGEGTRVSIKLQRERSAKHT